MPIQITPEAQKKIKHLKEIQQKSEDIDEDYELFLEDTCLSLRKLNSALGAVTCDFLSKAYLKEVRQNFSKSDSVFSFIKPLSKKLKIKKLKVLDLTAGLGRDLFKFVLAGHEVTGFEKDPLVFELLSDGVKRFFESTKEIEELKSSFKRDSDFSCKVYLKDSTKPVSAEGQWDVIYFDPMFDDDKKKAAPKKHMQFLKNLNLTKMNMDDKEEMIKGFLPYCKKFVLKASEFYSEALNLENEIKGKGYSYYIFNGKLDR